MSGVYGGEGRGFFLPHPSLRGNFPALSLLPRSHSSRGDEETRVNRASSGLNARKARFPLGCFTIGIYISRERYGAKLFAERLVSRSQPARARANYYRTLLWSFTGARPHPDRTTGGERERKRGEEGGEAIRIFRSRNTSYGCINKRSEFREHDTGM